MAHNDPDEENNLNEDEWSLWWDARLAAMETILGKPENIVLHGMIPFDLGAEMGGTPELVYFQ